MNENRKFLWQVKGLRLEHLLWALLFVVALVLRLAKLGAAPLSEMEAQQAMMTWRAVQGEALPATGYSPLLQTLNLPLFTLFGASDVLARLWPALFGSVLVLMPALFRRRIGRAGALAAGAYLTISPMALVASRRLDGTVMAAGGMLLVVSGWLYFLRTDSRRWLGLAGIGLAVCLTASSAAYGFLVSAALAALISAWIDPQSDLGVAFATVRPYVVWGVGVFLGSLFVLSTGLGFHLPGIGTVGDLLPAWLARFAAPLDAPSPLVLVALYEPLALLAGLASFVWGALSGRRGVIFLGLWAVLAAFMAAWMPGAYPLDGLWILLPLVLLAGLGFEDAVSSAERRVGVWTGEEIYIPVVVVLWVNIYLMLAAYGERYLYPEGSERYLLLAGMALLLQFILLITFSFASNIGTAWRSFGVGTGLVLLLATISAGWGVAYVPSNASLEPLLYWPTADGVHELVGALQGISRRETGLATALDFVFEAEEYSTLAWYLRDFESARRFAAWDASAPSDFLVTAQQEPTFPEGVAYAGQRFVLRYAWDPQSLWCQYQWPPQCQPLARWLLLRRVSAPFDVQDEVTLWRRVKDEN